MQTAWYIPHCAPAYSLVIHLFPISSLCEVGAREGRKNKQTMSVVSPSFAWPIPPLPHS